MIGFTRDGSSLLAFDTTAQNLHRLNLDGTLSKILVASGTVGRARETPDGTQIVVGRGSDFAVVDATTGATIRTFAAPTYGECSLPGWWDDTRFMCEASGGGAPVQVYLINATTGVTTQLTSGAPSSSPWGFRDGVGRLVGQRAGHAIQERDLGNDVPVERRRRLLHGIVAHEINVLRLTAT